MKAIFLDIDGVLVTRRTLKERSGMRSVADPKCVYALNFLLRTSGAVLVVSSSWRFCGLNELQAIFDYWKVSFPIHGLTPDLTRKDGALYIGVPRGQEIQAYLDANPEIKQFVILDDECDMAHLEADLLRTTFDDGLTEDIAHQAISKLNARNPFCDR